jgi:hypothetical protein
MVHRDDVENVSELILRDFIENSENNENFLLFQIIN